MAVPCAQTGGSVLHYYGIHVTRDVLWRLPDGRDIRRVDVYLQVGSRKPAF